MKTMFCIAAMLTLSFTTWAQQAKKIDNPRWKQLVYIDFQEGKYDRAITILKDYFEKAAKKANVSMPEAMLQMSSGTWDLLLIWHLKGGVDELNWEVHPDNVVWMKALSEITGGEDKAKALLDEYSGYIRQTQVELARVAY